MQKKVKIPLCSTTFVHRIAMHVARLSRASYSGADFNNKN